MIRMTTSSSTRVKPRESASWGGHAAGWRVRCMWCSSRRGGWCRDPSSSQRPDRPIELERQSADGRAAAPGRRGRRRGRRRGARAGRRRRPSRRAAPGSSRIASTSARSRSGVSAASSITTAAPPSCIQRAFAVWWSAVACGYGTSTAGRPYWASSKIEPPARATARSAAASAWPNGDDVVAQVVVRAGGRELGEVAPAGDVQHPVGSVGERRHGGLVDRAGAERAAEHEHAALVRRRSRARRAPARARRRAAAPGGRSRRSARPRGRRSGTPGRRAARAPASSRLLSPMCESASVSTSGTRRSTAASPTGPAT